jgi:NAD(P)-dependent dehydrogenase (short-subunit alcohol dehydrogenase family)
VVRSHVVTGGGRGIGRAVAERLLAGGDAVVVPGRDEAALRWTSAHPAGRRVIPLAGDAADEAVTGRAAGLAQEAGRLAGGLTRALAVDYGPRGIRVNAITPGTVATGRLQALLAADGGRSALGLDPEQAP